LKLKIILQITVIVVFAFSCDSCRNKKNEPWNHAGSNWQIVAEVSENYKSGKHASGLLSDGPTHIRYTGTLRIQEQPREEENYDIQQINLTGQIRYTHRREIGDTYRCEGYSGTCSENRIQITGGYWSHADPQNFMDLLPGPPPFNPGNYARYGFQIIISPIYEAFDTTHNNPCVFTYPCTTDEGESWSAMGVPPVLGTYYLGEASDRTIVWTQEDDFTIAVHKFQLECLTGCDPPEQEEEACDPEKTLDQCRQAKTHILNFCRTLNDWMVIEQYEDSPPLITCEGNDCSGAVAANEGNAPWVGITEHYSSACDDLAGDVACSVECFGWGETSDE
jgi:hypothetical protein